MLAKWFIFVKYFAARRLHAARALFLISFFQKVLFLKKWPFFNKLQSARRVACSTNILCGCTEIDKLTGKHFARVPLEQNWHPPPSWEKITFLKISNAFIFGARSWKFSRWKFLVFWSSLKKFGFSVPEIYKIGLKDGQIMENGLFSGSCGARINFF